MFRNAALLLLAFGLGACGSANAQQQETPYWATIDTTELNMRVGPSTEYKIEWVYRRKGLPLKVLRVKDDGWRYVEDHEGAKGWVNKNLLDPERGALVIGEDPAPMRAAPTDNSSLKWSLAPGVVGQLGPCEAGWCAFSVGNREGYVPADRLWGAGEP
ncbi:hypothetical protein LY632_08075 [Erythrobacter sp. SDW2]|uniref:SH3 domain-containing protein n=1 Tax=Erythrobacter sp. SDW2 TaxID=2907154 RepID=UPI001EFF3E8A|nr:SH3 domain-containing protein [Erythrobacter sp. SDW2]UIP05670.1 hypothetical protein LY632_08075 [Erythrobacter sp. SDW2]